VNRRILAVTFDVGGTLIEPQPSVGHIYSQVAAQHGVIGISPGLLNQRFAAAWREMEAFNYSRKEWGELVDRTFKGLTSKVPSETFFADLYGYFARPEAWRIFGDVFPALDALAARGIKLGIISNWDERLAPLLRAMRLYERFEVVVVSCEVGFCKPSTVPFDQAVLKLQCPRGSILHVGDNYETDVLGAQAAGFRGLELRRNSAEPSERQIRTLLDLLKHL